MVGMAHTRHMSATHSTLPCRTITKNLYTRTQEGPPRTRRHCRLAPGAAAAAAPHGCRWCRGRGAPSRPGGQRPRAPPETGCSGRPRSPSEPIACRGGSSRRPPSHRQPGVTVVVVVIVVIVVGCLLRGGRVSGFLRKLNLQRGGGRYMANVATCHVYLFPTVRSHVSCTAVVSFVAGWLVLPPIFWSARSGLLVGAVSWLR